MNQLTILANLAEILGVIIVVGGLYFASLQIRQFRQQRRELAAIELFRFFGNPTFTRAYKLMLQLPDGTTAADLKARDGRYEEAAMLVCATMESIGVMTFQRIVPFMVVNHLIGNSVVILWRKLENWVITLREELGNDAAFEWFQWLAERLTDYRPDDSRPAFELHKDWLPLHVRRLI
ncbi:MAG: hypothetical protein R3192_02505 [Woeseiaceae bacterium]|nr:hypothetical protein [Woeseiaceae bacterium]